MIITATHTLVVNVRYIVEALESVIFLDSHIDSTIDKGRSLNCMAINRCPKVRGAYLIELLKFLLNHVVNRVLSAGFVSFGRLLDFFLNALIKAILLLVCDMVSI